MIEAFPQNSWGWFENNMKILVFKISFSFKIEVWAENHLPQERTEPAWLIPLQKAGGALAAQWSC